MRLLNLLRHLDVNLGGELTDCLVAKGVPFVFITGYRGEAIDGRFASCRVLQKPIQRQMLQNAFVVGSRGSASGPVASIPTPLGGRAG